MLGERGGDQAELPVGATVEVVVGDEIEDGADDEEGPEPARGPGRGVIEAAPRRPPRGEAVTHEVTVVMSSRPAARPSRATLQQVLDAVNGPVRDYWGSRAGARSGSAGRGRTTTGPLRTADCSNASALWNEAATRAGWTDGPGRHLLVYLPRNSAGCSYGLAEIGGSTRPGEGSTSPTSRRP